MDEENLPEGVAKHPAWLRLEDQLDWYDRKSTHCQDWYKRLKLLQVFLAICIPIFSHLPPEAAKWLTACSGATIALVEAVQHMNQYSTLWVTYRSTAEHLKHEKYLFLAGAGVYRGVSDEERLVTLAERVEEHVSTEHANWFNETLRMAARSKQEAG